MILVDTSIWIDHLRAHDRILADLLHAGSVLIHPFVLGEIALGAMRQREAILTALRNLPQAGIAMDHEALAFIERHRLFGRGLGYVDVHLLAAVCLTPHARLWTRDRRLNEAARELDLNMLV